ncbi:MAG: thiamine diphosphokinase [bacterium]
MSKEATIWLAGSYPREQYDFYREKLTAALAGGTVVAVDAALILFTEFRLRPHVLLGDFDSIEPQLLEEYADCEQVIFDSDKDKTDGELALRYLLERGFRQIDIYGAIDTDFESDQMLANIFCLQTARDFPDARVRLVDHRQHIYMIESQAITLSGKPGDGVSVLPLSDEIELSVSGVRWELKEARIAFGSTWPLRNEFVESEVAITIDKRAVVVHRYA